MLQTVNCPTYAIDMTRSRLFIVLLIVSALLVGVFLGRDSKQSPRPAGGGLVVSSSEKAIRMPGLWLGTTFRGGVPMVSLTRVPGGKLNGLYYALFYPARALVAIEPFTGRQPSNAVVVKTPVGDAALSPDGKYAVMKDPQGNELKIQSYTGSVRDVLKVLRERPSGN
jgi:hypothetical protein